ncbi:MAG: cell division protein FtsL [Pseudomonadota bacterium]|jgi:cell division protein FtsL
MTRIHLVLLGVLVLSALLLVRTAYDARRLFAEIDKARSQERVLEAEYQRLDAERRAQATHLRVERVAREKLQMRTATPAVTHYVPGAAGAAAAVPASGASGAVR